MYAYDHRPAPRPAIRTLASAALATILALPPTAAPAAPPNGDGSAICGTTIFGGPVASTTWTAVGSPYCVKGDLQVSLLVIEPGVEVFVDGPYEISVSSISAVGTREAPILFSAKDVTVPWRGLEFDNVAPGSELVHCVIECSDDSGIRITNSSPVINHCLVRNNTSPSGGGGIRASLLAGDLTITNTRIRGNAASASNGGGIDATMGAGTLILAGCTISDNATTTEFPAYGSFTGGGVHVTGNSSFQDCEIVRNDNFGYAFNNALSRGGGVYTENGVADWRNCTIADNVATSRSSGGASWPTHSHGGGTYVASGSLVATNCVVAGNQLVVTKGAPSGHRAGGIFVNDGTVALVNSTIARNDLEGLYRLAGTVDVLNSIVYFNDAGGDQLGGAISVDYSCVQNWPAAGTNVGWNPAFAGTSTGRCDFVLLPGSPCVDLGHPDGAFEDAWFRPPTTDRNDMGAFGGPENVWAHDGAWEDLGQGLAGTDAKTPTLTTGCPLRDDGLLTYTLENGLPDSSAVYVLGVSLLNAPFRGGTMVPDADVIVPGLPIDGAGNLAIAYSWIPGLPSGVTTWHQFWVVDPGGPLGFSASNAWSATQP